MYVKSRNAHPVFRAPERLLWRATLLKAVRVENHVIAPSANPNPAASTAVSEVVPYFPLRVGYVWTYVEQIITTSSATSLQRPVSLTIQRQLNHEYLAQWDFQSGRTRLPNIRYRIVTDGIQQALLTGDTAYTPFVYVLKAPLVVGTTWHGLQNYPVRISAVALSCTVPAGVFNQCVETLQDIEPLPENRLLTRRRFAPGIGLVWQQRRLFQHGNLTRTDTMELQKRPQPLQL